MSAVAFKPTAMAETPFHAPSRKTLALTANLTVPSMMFSGPPEKSEKLDTPVAESSCATVSAAEYFDQTAPSHLPAHTPASVPATSPATYAAVTSQVKPVMPDCVARQYLER